MRRLVAAAVGLLVLGTGLARGQEGQAGVIPPEALVRPETILGAILGLEVDREIANRALARDLQKLARWKQRREAAMQALKGLYEELDLALEEQGAEAEGQAEALEIRAFSRQADLALLGQEGRDLRSRIFESRSRLDILADKSAELVAMLPDDRESVTGIWDARLVPINESGVITLFQTGTILTGEYILDGGWRGSVQGTLVDGRVHLERIDAVKGRFADLSGDLEPSGQVIRGVWRERDLAANRPVEGSWIARKRSRQAPERP